jgi:hypothetical protein
MPRPEAYTLALSKAGNNVPAATAWLHQHGIRASDDALYRHRHNVHAGTTTPVERPQPTQPVRQPDRPAYTPPEHVTAVTNARERARAAADDYRTRFGHLPTRREVMTATGVSESTAMRALRPLKAEHAPQRVDAEPGRAVVSSPSLTPTRQTADSRGAGATADQTRSGSRGERTVVDEAPHGDRRRESAGRDRAGDVVIEQARAAVAVLAAHRQLREQQRREREQARAEQLNRWHHDDAQQAAARAREGWGLAR